MKIQTINVKNLIVKSNLPASDYVINPYIGCSHRCRYCYASFMKRFTKHAEEWGDFVDIKECPQLKLPKNISQKTVLISSVTDPYQPLERKFAVTRQILQQLAGTPARIEILTKSQLVTRDIDLLKKIPDIHVGISMNTLQESFRREMEPGASSVSQRLDVLKRLHNAGIPTYLFVSPIFPGITDLEELIENVSGYVEEICFENLNLKGSQRVSILSYIKEKYPSLLPLYQAIYMKRQTGYWDEMEQQILSFANRSSIKLTNYFYHDQIKKRRNPDEHLIS